MRGDYFSLIAILSMVSVTMLYLGSQTNTTYVYDTASNLQKRFRTKLTESMPTCCKALTKECLSCAAGMLVKDFCDRHKGEYGCPNVTVTSPPDQNIQKDIYLKDDIGPKYLVRIVSTDRTKTFNIRNRKKQDVNYFQSSYRQISQAFGKVEVFTDHKTPLYKGVKYLHVKEPIEKRDVRLYALKMYRNALRNANGSHVLLFEDDVDLTLNIREKIDNALKIFESRNIKDFILDCSNIWNRGTYDFVGDLKRITYDFGTVCMFYSSDAVKRVLETLTKQKSIRGIDGYDISIRHLKIPTYAYTRSLVQHMGVKTTGLAGLPYPTSSTFIKSDGGVVYTCDQIEIKDLAKYAFQDIPVINFRGQSSKDDLLLYGAYGGCSHTKNSPETRCNCIVPNIKAKQIWINGEPNSVKVQDNIRLFGVGGDKFYYVQVAYATSEHKERLLTRPKNTMERFMHYTASNCVQYRDDAFDLISQFKQVDALGKCKSNKQRNGNWFGNSNGIFTKYRFSLCMENSNKSGYITEKILNAFFSGSIPVYYGTNEIFNIFNRRAFIYYDILRPNDAIQKIKYLEQNPNEYNKMLNEPILAPGAYDKYFSPLAIKNTLLGKSEKITVMKKEDNLIFEFYKECIDILSRACKKHGVQWYGWGGGTLQLLRTNTNHYIFNNEVVFTDGDFDVNLISSDLNDIHKVWKELPSMNTKNVFIPVNNCEGVKGCGSVMFPTGSFKRKLKDWCKTTVKTYGKARGVGELREKNEDGCPPLMKSHLPNFAVWGPGIITNRGIHMRNTFYGKKDYYVPNILPLYETYWYDIKIPIPHPRAFLHHKEDKEIGSYGKTYEQIAWPSSLFGEEPISALKKYAKNIAGSSFLNREHYNLDYPNGMKTPLSWSQYGQDRYIANLLPEGGYFVEVGGYDGERFSNTLLLEKEYGWNGVLIEANPYTFDILKSRNRKASAFNNCIGKGSLTFKISGSTTSALETMTETHRKRINSDIKTYGFDKTGDKRWKHSGETITTICKPLISMISTTKIDYFSLDVEGGEMLILNEIEWDELDIRVFSIEVDQNTEEIRQFMRNKGYIEKAKLSGDIIFVKESFLDMKFPAVSDVVINIGSNIDPISANKDGLALIFEPIVYKEAAKNAKKNDIRTGGMSIVIPAAVADAPGYKYITLYNTNAVSSSFAKPSKKQSWNSNTLRDGKKMSVKVYTMNQIIDWVPKNVPIKEVKIDIQGYDFLAVSNTNTEKLNRVQSLITEVYMGESTYEGVKNNLCDDWVPFMHKIGWEVKKIVIQCSPFQVFYSAEICNDSNKPKCEANAFWIKKKTT